MNDTAPLSLCWLRWALGAVASVVVIEAALGFAGATAAAAPVIGAMALGAGALAARRGWRVLRGQLTDSAPEAREPTATAADGWAAVALAVAVASRLAEGLHHTGGAFTYDVLSYHLHLPASWWATGRVGIVPTPFGDQAPAYAPANAELTYLLALATTGNLRLAHAGQAAYAGLASLAIVATARQLGVSRRLACGAGLAFLMVPEVWQQAAGAMADLALASFVLACLPFLLRLRDRRAPADILALGAGLGLAVGTKYVGAVLVLPLLAATAWGLARGGSGGWPRRRAAGAVVALVLGCGGFWYVRNTVLTGDPTFPVTLRLAGVTVGRGLYGAAEMRRWVYHLPLGDLQPLLEMFTETGWGFLLCLAGGLVGVPRPRRGLAVGLFGAYVALGWLMVPYQQSRFLFAAWGVAALAAALAAGAIERPALREWGLGPAIVGAALQYPTATRLLAAGLWTLAAALGAREGAAASPARAPRRFVAAALWLCPPGLGLLALVIGGWTCLPGHADPQLARVGDGHDEGWAYASVNLRGRHIAYTGSNLPLPLWGWRLQNRVRYVNVAGKVTDVLHDFGALATGPATAEPAPERARPDRNAWLANLNAAGTDALFVARLYPEVLPSMPHDGDGFPTERAWADALPGRFRLAFATPEVRIYDVRPEMDQARPGPPGPEQRRANGR